MFHPFKDQSLCLAIRHWFPLHLFQSSSLYAGLHHSTLHRLQNSHNAPFLLTGIKTVQFRIRFMVLLTTFKVLNSLGPSYLWDLLTFKLHREISAQQTSLPFMLWEPSWNIEGDYAFAVAALKRCNGIFCYIWTAVLNLLNIHWKHILSCKSWTYGDSETQTFLVVPCGLWYNLFFDHLLLCYIGQLMLIVMWCYETSVDIHIEKSKKVQLGWIFFQGTEWVWPNLGEASVEGSNGSQIMAQPCGESHPYLKHPPNSAQNCILLFSRIRRMS